jgi:hypothetical protein
MSFCLDCGRYFDDSTTVHNYCSPTCAVAALPKLKAALEDALREYDATRLDVGPESYRLRSAYLAVQGAASRYNGAMMEARLKP